MKKPRLHETVATLLESKLKTFVSDGKSLNRTTCIEIYQIIFETFVDVMRESNVKITNESMNWLAQQYYESVLINNQHTLDPTIFDPPARLSEIETKELALMAVMLHQTDFAIPLVHEIKKRS
jgi:hypothetical protein